MRSNIGPSSSHRSPDTPQAPAPAAPKASPAPQQPLHLLPPAPRREPAPVEPQTKATLESLPARRVGDIKLPRSTPSASWSSIRTRTRPARQSLQEISPQRWIRGVATTRQGIVHRRRPDLISGLVPPGGTDSVRARRRHQAVRGLPPGTRLARLKAVRATRQAPRCHGKSAPSASAVARPSFAYAPSTGLKTPRCLLRTSPGPPPRNIKAPSLATTAPTTPASRHRRPPKPR